MITTSIIIVINIIVFNSAVRGADSEKFRIWQWKQFSMRCSDTSGWYEAVSEFMLIQTWKPTIKERRHRRVVDETAICVKWEGAAGRTRVRIYWHRYPAESLYSTFTAKLIDHLIINVRSIHSWRERRISFSW